MKTSEIMGWLLLLQLDNDIGDKLIIDPISGEKRKVSTIAANALQQVYKSGEIIEKAEDLVNRINREILDKRESDAEIEFLESGKIYYICNGCGYKIDKINMKFCPKCGAKVQY